MPFAIGFLEPVLGIPMILPSVSCDSATFPEARPLVGTSN